MKIKFPHSGVGRRFDVSGMGGKWNQFSVQSGWFYDVASFTKNSPLVPINPFEISAHWRNLRMQKGQGRCGHNSKQFGRINRSSGFVYGKINFGESRVCGIAVVVGK